MTKTDHKKSNTLSLKQIQKQYRRRKTIKIIAIVVGIIVVIFAGYGTYAVMHIKNVEADRATVNIQKKKSVILFYRDDCPDCQKIFGQVLAGKDAGLPVQLVNTNNQNNKQKYIAKYHLKSVPTFITIDNQGREIDRYVGTDRSRIDEILKNIERY